MVQYKTSVLWDSSLVSLSLIESTPATRKAGIAGAIQFAVKITAGAPTATPGKFMPSAEVFNAVTGTIYRNGGTLALPVFVTGGSGTSVTQAIKITNGTTPVNVFGNPSGVGGVIQSISVQALDTTAGNIIIKDTAGTVATIAKGTVIGVITGAGAIANPTFTAAGILTIESSSVGNAVVYITYTPA